MTFCSLPSHKVTGGDPADMLRGERHVGAILMTCVIVDGEYSFSRWKRWNMEIYFLLESE